MRAFNFWIQLRGLDSSACERAPIGESGFVASFLRSHILLQPSLLFAPDGLQRPIIERRVKRQARSVKLLHYCNIQLLLCNQDFDVSTSERRRHSYVEQSLRQGAAPQAEPFYSALTSPVADLNTGRVIASCNAHAQFPPASTLKMLTVVTVLPLASVLPGWI